MLTFWFGSCFRGVFLAFGFGLCLGFGLCSFFLTCLRVLCRPFTLVSGIISKIYGLLAQRIMIMEHDVGSWGVRTGALGIGVGVRS